MLPEAAFCEALADPAGQSVHIILLEENLPGEHPVQMSRPSELATKPATQSTQVEGELAAVAADAFPALQRLQTLLPTPLANVPAGQAIQPLDWELAPCTFPYRPTGQL